MASRENTRAHTHTHNEKRYITDLSVRVGGIKIFKIYHGFVCPGGISSFVWSTENSPVWSRGCEVWHLVFWSVGQLFRSKVINLLTIYGGHVSGKSMNSYSSSVLQLLLPRSLEKPRESGVFGLCQLGTDWITLQQTLGDKSLLKLCVGVTKHAQKGRKGQMWESERKGGELEEI